MSTISNPLGSHRRVADFRTGVSDDGDPLNVPPLTSPYRANAAISKGDVLAFVVATQTTPLSVKPMTSTDDHYLFAGVAQHGVATADIGQTVLVTVYGDAVARVTNGVAAGERLGRPKVGEDGQGDGNSGAATTGQEFGTILGPKATTGPATGMAPVFVRQS